MPAINDKQKQFRFTPYARQHGPDSFGHSASEVAQALRAALERHSTEHIGDRDADVKAGERYRVVKDGLKNAIEARVAEIRLEEKERLEAELAEARRRDELDKLNRLHQANVRQAQKERAKHSRPQEESRQSRRKGQQGRQRSSEEGMSSGKSEQGSPVVDTEKIYSVYFSRWDAIKRTKPTAPGTMAFYQLPWPILSPIVISANAITEAEVRRFYEGGIAQDKAKLRSELLRWHPDKFNSLVLRRVPEAEKKMASAAAACVLRCINSIMKELY